MKRKTNSEPGSAPRPAARLKESGALIAVLLAAALIVAAGVFVPELLLRRRQAQLMTAGGAVEAAEIDPYSHRTTPQRVAALSTLLTADPGSLSGWSASRTPFQNELSETDAAAQARALFSELCVRLVGETEMQLPPTLLERADLFSAGWTWDTGRFLTAADDTTLSVWRFELSCGASLTLDAVSGLPLACTVPVDFCEYPLDALWWTCSYFLYEQTAGQYRLEYSNGPLEILTTDGTDGMLPAPEENLEFTQECSAAISEEYTLLLRAHCRYTAVTSGSSYRLSPTLRSLEIFLTA